MFWNTNDIIAVNTKLRDALIKRQKSYAVVERIGDVLLEYIPQFEPFVKYGSHQLYGKFQFEKEKNSNPAFAQFVEVSNWYQKAHATVESEESFLLIDYRTSARIQKA